MAVLNVEESVSWSVRINPFSEVSTQAMSSSSEDESEDGVDAAKESGEDSSSLSDSSSQIVCLQFRPRQRVRLLATFRLSSLPGGTAASDQPLAKVYPQASADSDALQVFHSSLAALGNLGMTDEHALPGNEGGAFATSATVHRFQRGVPQMVVLDKETDLTAGLKGARSPCTHLIRSAPAEHNSAAMADALAALVGMSKEDDVPHDFVASTATMKTIFGLTSSNTSVTVAVHRVDNTTLVLNGVINGETRLSRDVPLPGSSSPIIPSQQGSSTISPRICASDGETEMKDTSDLGNKKAGGRKKKKKKKIGNVEVDEPNIDHLSSLYSKFMYYSASASDDPAEPALEKNIEEGLIEEALEEGGQAGSGCEAGQQGNRCERDIIDNIGQADEQSEEAQVFRRAVQFRFHDLNLLLGSDTVIFNRGPRTSELSLRLQDVDSEIPKLTCLDYWLDNIFNEVPHTAVCYHKEGKVHGYQLVRTQDIPSWSGFGSSFSPKAVMQSASSILHFLQTHCTKEAGTYWLCRPQGSDEIQLYCLDDGENGQAAAPSALSQPVGLLCFKIARRLQMQDREASGAGRGASSKNRERTARLFCNAISVLDEGLHPTVVSLSHEGLADAMVGAQWASPAAQCAGPVAAQCSAPNHHATATAPNQQQQHACGSGSVAEEATLAATPPTPAAADGEPEAEAQFYVDENGDLQDAKAGGGHLDEDEAPRAGVGDTAQWGAAYSLADLENAESHYIQAANVRSIALSAHERAAAAAAPARCHQRAPARGKGLHMRWSKKKTESEEEDGMVMAVVVSRRLRCKAGKCAIAIAMRLLRKGGVAEALIKAVNAFDRCVGGQSREEQEVVSEAMEVWADVHVALAGLTRDQVLKIRGEVEEIEEQERILSAGTFDFTPKSPASETQGDSRSEREAGGAREAGGRDMTPMSHPLSPDIEDNCNHAIRYLIRSLQFCNAVCRRRDLSKKLAAVYSQLGAHYMSMGRFTRAHQHYQQGTQLFHSIGDEEAAATLTFKLACLFSARAHAAPMSVGLTAEQQTDLFKARSLVLQAYQILQAKQEAMVAKEASRRTGKEGAGPAVLAAPPPYPLCRAHKALKEMVAQVEEELADIHMAIAVGKLHATGVTPPYLLATNALPRTSPLGEDEGSLESESAESGLSRALSTYESLGLPQAAAAHLHLAFLMWRVEAEAAALLNKAAGEDRGAAVRAVKTWRQRSERHAQQALALAKTVADKVRVTCIRAELAMKRADTGCVGGVVAAVEALLQLPQLASNCRPHAAPSCCSVPQEQGVGGGAGYATAAQFGQASAGVRGGGGGSLARWAPFDGGWGAMTHVSRDAVTCDAYKRDPLSHSLSSLSSSSDAATQSGDAAFCEDELNGVWVCAQRHALSALMFLVRQHSGRKGAGCEAEKEKAERYKRLFRSALTLSQQHAGKRFLLLLSDEYALSAKESFKSAVAEETEEDAE